MTPPTAPFHLHASQSAPDSPVDTPGDLPSEIAGQPATYFWKEMIHLGDYIHPTKNFTLSVDQPRLQKWLNTGEQMLADGVPIPINCDHSDRARDVVGYVKAFKLDGERLLALCQFIGEDAAILAARNLVSVGIDPDFTDGQGNNWGEAIVHLALTPTPVVPNQGEFFAASISDDTLVQLPPIPSPGTPGEGEGGGAFPSAPDAPAKVRRASRRSSATESLTAQLAQAREQIAQLSSRLPPEITDESANALIEAATNKFDAAVARGGLSPAARDRLIEILVRSHDGRPNLLALSRHSNPRGNRALAMAVADILLDNPPLIPGEFTGFQAIARSIPGEDSSPIAQLQQYMTRVASK